MPPGGIRNGGGWGLVTTVLPAASALGMAPGPRPACLGVGRSPAPHDTSSCLPHPESPTRIGGGGGGGGGESGDVAIPGHAGHGTNCCDVPRLGVGLSLSARPRLSFLCASRACSRYEDARYPADVAVFAVDACLSDANGSCVVGGPGCAGGAGGWRSSEGRALLPSSSPPTGTIVCSPLLSPP